MLDKENRERVQYSKAQGIGVSLGGEIAGRSSPPRRICYRLYLLMESFFMESPLTIFTLIT